MASSKVMNPGQSTKHRPPPLPELVLIATTVSYQGARVLIEAEGREGESEGDHSDSQSSWLLMECGDKRGLSWPHSYRFCWKNVDVYRNFQFYGISGMSLTFKMCFPYNKSPRNSESQILSKQFYQFYCNCSFRHFSLTEVNNKKLLFQLEHNETF